MIARTTTLGRDGWREQATGGTHGRCRLVRRAVLLGVAVLLVTACGGADPEADPELSTAPTVPLLDVVVTGEVATLVANIVDPDGEVAAVIVAWGDGTRDTVTSGFPGVRLDHTYTADGDFTIVLEARNAAGQSAIATTEASITAFAEAADAAPDDSDGGSDGDESSSGGSDSSGGDGGGAGTAPPPTPSPSPEPEPEPVPEEPEPEPIPEPVTLDLRDDQVEPRLFVNPPDNAGGRAEAEQQGPSAFGIRSYAWHGYNGHGFAEGWLVRRVDATSVLADMPEQVTGVTAEVSYELDVTVELKGPYDRRSSFTVLVERDGPSDSESTIVAQAAVEFYDADPIKRVSAVGSTGTLTTTLTRDEPVTTFKVKAVCVSRSGSKAFALLNEGYCDALEKGGITLRALTVTYTPVVVD